MLWLHDIARFCSPANKARLRERLEFPSSFQGLHEASNSPQTEQFLRMPSYMQQNILKHATHIFKKNVVTCRQPKKLNPWQPWVRIVIVRLVPLQSKLFVESLVQRKDHRSHLRLPSCQGGHVIDSLLRPRSAPCVWICFSNSHLYQTEKKHIPSIDEWAVSPSSNVLLWFNTLMIQIRSTQIMTLHNRKWYNRTLYQALLHHFRA